MGEGTSSTRFTAGLSGDARVVGEMKAFSGAFCEFGEVWGAREHAGEGEIEVERWPVQAATATDDLEVALGGWGGGVKCHCTYKLLLSDVMRHPTELYAKSLVHNRSR